MTDTAIRVENLRKRYRVGPRQHYRVLRDSIASALRAPLRRLAGDGGGQPRGDFIWALDGVSFEVRQGEIVGVIGRNGAGKSTLLKILSRITEPTEGYAELHGRVGSLLEVGTGFHPELTGRENVYLNGAILGMSRGEIDRKLPEIVEFSGLSRFLDTPLKYYSSGMAVRLGFAVAAHLEPEILIVDEVLAVGDVAFQQRCIGKMQEVAGGGRTVLFVSHNMRAVASLCPQSIWLDAGKIVFEGRSEEAIARYVEASRAGMSSLAERAERRGSGALRIVAAHIEDGDGNPSDTVRAGEPVRFVLDYEHSGNADLSTLQVNIVLSAGGGRGIVSFLSDTSGAEFGGAPRRGRLVCSVPELPLAPGLYDLQFSCLLGRALADKVPQAGSLVVTEGDFFGTGRLPGDVDYYGPVLVRHAWSVEPSPEAGEERS